ncbi:MAG: sulfatase-like hydrolase/transferase [Acidobacteriota bacterium]|nr:sulfatase-like hydrolase/transferase [Acidobacteriota bacterium]
MKQICLALGIGPVVALSFIPVGCRRAAEAPSDLDFINANVLLITLDTTRADRIGAYGYESAETPRMDELAFEGMLFETAVTPTAFTLPSHSSIMTGFYPPYHGVRLNGGAALADVHETLAERLSIAGYRCGAVIGAFVLDQRWGLGQGFESFDDDFDVGPDQKLDLAGVQRPGDQVVDLSLDWLNQPDERPFFAWLHFYDPHKPYNPPEPYRSQFSGRGKDGLYDGEIAFTDSQVGRLLDWLDERGLAENTVIVVVGDHGESLGDHGEKEHGYYIYDATVKVPLIVRVPGRDLEGVRIPAQVRTIDVLPTVLDLVGVEAPDPLHGSSLVPLMLETSGEGPKFSYSESMAVNLQYGWSALYGVRTSSYKFIDAPRAELYNLSLDPRETNNVLRSEKPLADEFRAVLTKLREDVEAGAPETQEADLDQETLGMLAALGYVGGASVAVEGEDLADPKDKILFYEAIGYAAHLMEGDEYEEVAEVLERVLDEDPAIPQAKLLLATAYQNTGRVEDAKMVLDDFLKDDPDNTAAAITMAKMLSEEGKDDEVMALARRVLAADDRNTQAWELVAGVHMRANDHQSALNPLQKAVEIQPKLTRNRLNLAVANMGLGRLDLAEPMLDAIIAEYPEFPFAHFHLGLLYEGQGRFDASCAAYSLELELFPEAIMARFNLGDLLFRMGDVAGAEREMRVLIEADAEAPKPYLLLARILLKQERDLPEVERLARAGLERAEADELKVLGYYLLSDVYSRQGRQAELQQVLERAQYYRSRIEGAS